MMYIGNLFHYLHQDNISPLSASGQYQSAVADIGNIYLSSNYGVTWTVNTSSPNTNWQSISVSSSGQYQSAGIYGDGIYISSDFGANWALNSSAGTANWSSISLSSSGQYQSAVVNGGGIYTCKSNIDYYSVLNSSNSVTNVTGPGYASLLTGTSYTIGGTMLTPLTSYSIYIPNGLTISSTTPFVFNGLI